MSKHNTGDIEDDTGIPECSSLKSCDQEYVLLESNQVGYDPFNPPHYKGHGSGIQCIEVTEHMNFTLGNAVKYIWRAGLKNSESKNKDLKKAIWYLKREISKGE